MTRRLPKWESELHKAQRMLELARGEGRDPYTHIGGAKRAVEAALADLVALDERLDGALSKVAVDQPC